MSHLSTSIFQLPACYAESSTFDISAAMHKKLIIADKRETSSKMPRFRMMRKGRERRQTSPPAALDSPAATLASMFASDSIEIQHHPKALSPHDSAQDLSDKLSGLTVHGSDGRPDDQPTLQRNASISGGRRIRSPPPIPSDCLVVGAGPAGLMLA
jgi:hypothetical protein